MRYFISLIIIFSSFSTFAAPPNDDPCNAIVLTSSLNCNYVQYTNAAATATAGVTAPACANYAGGDVWFQVVVPAGGSIRINSNTGVMTDGGMAVYSGTCGSLTLISCDDDSSPNGLMPYLTLTGLTPGSTVWIRFWEYGNDNNGTFSICVTIPPPPPTNDNPCNATLISAQPTCSYQTFTNESATGTTGAPAPGCGSYLGGDVWFKVVVPCNGSVAVNTLADFMTDGDMAIYKGTCNNLTLLACDDLSGTGSMPYISLSNQVVGDTLWIRVWEYGNNNNGTFGICASVPPPVGPGDQCQSAIPFCTGTNYSFPNNTNVPSLGGGGIYDCLLTTPNPVWYFLQVQNSGNISITIKQKDLTGGTLDVDFALWGPFTSSSNGCSSISATNIVDCSYSIAATEVADIPNAIAGEFYLLLITNFSNLPGTISFQQTGGTASTNCAVICNLTASNTGPICAGTTFNLNTTSVTGATYSWLGPNCYSSTQQNPTGLTAPTLPGSYTYVVTATTPAGSTCQSSTSVIVTQLTGTASTTNASCSSTSDGSITASPTPSGNYTYTLTPGGTIQNNNPIFTGLAPNTYSIAISNTAGCSGTISNIILSAGSSLSGTANAVNTSCRGANNGSITINPNIPDNYTFTLNPGGIIQNNNPLFTGLAPNTYSVTFTNPAGCSGIISNILVDTGATITGSASSIIASCSVASNGSITVVPTTGTLPFSFSLDGGPSQSNATFSGITAGPHSVIFTDANGCSGTATDTIRFGTNPTGSALSTPTACPGVNDGTITITTLGGSNPYQYSLDLGAPQISNIFIGVASGIHNIDFTDAFGCPGSTSVTVQPGTSISSNIIPVNPPCALINDGTITITPTSGLGPYEYSLNSGAFQSSNLFSGLAPGNYSIDIRNLAGCTGANTISLSTNSLLTTSISLSMPLCNGSSDGSISATPSNGVSPYQYSIDAGANYQPSATFNGLPDGSYTIRIQDNVGCIKDTTLTLIEPSLLTASAISTPATCGGNDGNITISAAGGTPAYSYSINNGTTFQASNSFTVPDGNYLNIIVKDNNQCTAQTNVVVTRIDNMFLQLDPSDTIICRESSITFQPVTNPQTTIFSWTSPDAPLSTLNNPSIKNAIATPIDTCHYILNATWGVCQRSDTIIINVLHKPIADAGLDSAICFDQQLCNLHGSASNLSGTVNYLWSPSALVASPNSANTTALITTSTIFTLTVTDNYGCNYSVTDQVTIGKQPPVPAFAGNDTITGTNIPIQLYASGGATYLWSPAAPLNDIYSNSPIAIIQNDTRFFVTVTDIAGCIGSDTVFVKVYDGPTYYVPNAFSPNGDGLNDIFRPVPVGIAKTDFFRVYNRYGEIIFETNQWLKGWDGTFRGRHQSIGTYVWTLKGTDINGKQIEMKGSVVLIR